MLKRTARRLLAWSVVFAMLFSLTVQPVAAADTSGDSSAAVYSAQADEDAADESTETEPAEEEAETDPADADSGEADESADESADASAGEDTGEASEEADASTNEAEDEADTGEPVAASEDAEEEEEASTPILGASAVTYDADGFYTDGDATYYEPATLSDGVYEISNAGQLFWFAALVNGDTTQEDITKANGSASAVLTTDITIPSGYEWTTIGGYYTGTFDGGGYTVSGVTLTATEDGADGLEEYPYGMFGCVAGAIKDLTLADSTISVTCEDSGSSIWVGGIAGQLLGNTAATNISNCAVENVQVSASGIASFVEIGGMVGCYEGGGDETCVINCTADADTTVSADMTSARSVMIGGIVGMCDSAATGCASAATVSAAGSCNSASVGGVVGSEGALTNCYSTGSVSCTCTCSSSASVGGVVGRLGGDITNCYSTATLSNSNDSTTKYTGGVVGYNGSSSYTMTNCYYLDTSADAGTGNRTDTATAKTEDEFASGEVAYLLNGSVSGGDTWFQNLDNGKTVDASPVLDSTHGAVYYGISCLSTEASYSNSVLGDSAEHSYDEDGFCAVCGAYQPAELNSDGYYEIDNAGKLFWFSALVNGYTTITTDSGTEVTLEGIDVATRGANAILTADIDLSVTTDTHTSNLWTPIGDEQVGSYSFERNFTGTFDGDGHTITGLTIDTDNACQGLFGFTESSTITDLTLAEVSVSAGSYAGALAGTIYGGSITNVYVTSGTITGTGDAVGGLAGMVRTYSAVSGCYNAATVIASGSYAGGITGNLWNGATITNCYNAGAISSNTYVAGIAGLTGSATTTITSCYNVGTLSSSGTVGGIVGTVSGTHTVSNSYYLEDTADYGIGSDTSDTTSAVSKTADEFASGEVAYLLNGSADAGSVWFQNLDNGEEADSYPVLDSEHGTVYGGYISCTSEELVYSNSSDGMSETVGHTYDSNGFCTRCGNYEPAEQVDGVYQIENAGNLFWFAALVNGEGSHAYLENGQDSSASAILVNNIDLSVTTDTHTDTAWTPIGNTNSNYTGSFDGNSCTVSGLYIDSTSGYQGLFGYVGEGGEVADVTVSGEMTVLIWSDADAGGVAGYNAGTLTNCTNQVNVWGFRQYVGGVVGYNVGTVTGCTNAGTITGGWVEGEEGNGVCYSIGGVAGFNSGSVTDCTNSGEVITENSTSHSGTYVGGIVGDFRGGTVSNCTNSGAVTAYDLVGGVVGYTPSAAFISGVESNVTNCVNEGDVTGGYQVGGIVGSNCSNVSNCYNSGAVSCNTTSSSDYIGGVVGYNGGSLLGYSGGTVTNCYSTGTVSDGNYVGGVAGLNYGTVTNCYYLDTAADTAVADEGGTTTDTTSKTEEAFNSGEVAYLLNGSSSEDVAWYQTLGTDDYPLLDSASGIVYCLTDCAGSTTGYSNTKQTTVTHTYDENGFCEYCGEYEPAELNSNGYYEIENAGNLFWFAALVNGDTSHEGVDVRNTSANAVLTKGIDLNNREWASMGDYAGTFDGGGYTISNLYISSGEYTGLFGYIASGGVVQNVTVSGSVTGTTRVGGVAGHSSGTILNCVNNCTITGTEGASYLGGIVGQIYEASMVSGCVNNGTVSGTTSGTTYVGGVVGYNSGGTVSNCCNTNTVSGIYDVGGVAGDSYGTISNCYNTGTVTGSSFVGGVVGFNSYTVTNCYYLEGTADTAVGDGYGTTTDTTSKTETEFASGEVAWLLQNGQSEQVWGQALTGNAEAYPVLTDEAAKLVVKLDFYLVEDGEASETAFDTRYTNSGATLASYPSSDETTYAFYTAETCTDEDEIDTAAYTYSADSKVYVASKAEFTVWYGETEITLDADETYDLTQAYDDELGYGVPEGYLYGGTFTDEDFAEVIDPDTCGSGVAFTPQAGETYYVKLVDDSYFMLKCLLAYEVYVPTNLWLVTNIDSNAYCGYGFDLIYGEDDEDSVNVASEDAAKQLYQELELNGKVYTGTVDISNFTGFSSADYDETDETSNLVGYYDLSDSMSDLLEMEEFTVVPFFVTQDGVKVTGAVERTISLTDTASSVSKMYSVSDKTVASTTEEYDGEVDDEAAAIMLTSYLNVSATALITNIDDGEETTTYTITKYDGDAVTTQEVEEGATNVTVEYTEKDGYLFAGWFTDEDYTTAADFSEITGDMTVYAKYVSADYLQVKASTVSSKGVVKSIRMISATDSKNYAEVGFVYQYGDVESSVEVTKYSTSISGKTAKTLYGGNVVAGSKLIYADLSVSGMEAGTAVTITPYWVTLDGTTVYGAERTITYTGSGIE